MQAQLRLSQDQPKKVKLSRDPSQFSVYLSIEQAEMRPQLLHGACRKNASAAALSYGVILFRLGSPPQ